MLNGISKLLTGDVLKILCDMGHGDVLILADANFPAESLARHTALGQVIRLPGVDVITLFSAIADLFPLDAAYTDHPACVMDLTDGDKQRNMPLPAAWEDFQTLLTEKYPGCTLGKIQRFDFYDRAGKAYAVIQTGEERQYGNLLLVKGCVL